MNVNGFNIAYVMLCYGGNIQKKKKEILRFSFVNSLCMIFKFALNFVYFMFGLILKHM